MKSIREFETKIYEKINPLVSFSVRRYVLAIGVFVAIFVFGLISTLTMGIDQLPQINIPVVVVTTSYPGATPTVIDQQITQVLENAVSAVTGVTDINSVSSTGSSRIFMHFDITTDQNSDTNQVAAQVDAAVKDLPLGVQPPTVQTFDPSLLPILQFAISGNGENLGDVSDYVTNTFTPMLERVPGVAYVQVDGAPNRTFTIYLNPNALANYGITPQTVVNAVENSAVNQPIGTIVSHNNSLTFATQNMPADVKDVQDIIVDPTRNISVRDVASVRDLPVPTNYARVNGVPVVLISISQTTTSNEVAVVDGVRKLLKHTRFPEGFTYFISNDTTTPMRASIQSTYHELFETVLVVALIVLLFLGRLNSAFSVVLAIPISLSAAPVLYNLAGFTFNLVSLLALIVAIGIVVDDSIVVSENVDRYRAMGFSMKESVLRGASEIFSAVVASSFSLLSVLLPVSFIPGFIGSYVRQFGLGLAAAVILSLLEALLFLTVRLSYTPEGKPVSWPDFFKSFARFKPAMQWGFKSWHKGPWLMLGIAILIVLLATHHFVFIPALILYPMALAVLNYSIFVVYGLLSALTETLHGYTEKGLVAVRDGYASLLDRSLKVGSVYILAGSGVLIFGIFILFVLPRAQFNFVPNADNDALGVNMQLPPGTPAIVTNTVTSDFEAYLLKRPEVTVVQTVVGSQGVFSGGVNQNQNATLTIQLTPVTQRESIFKLMTVYRKAFLGYLSAFPSARLTLSAAGGFQGSGTSVSISFISSNENLLFDKNNALLQAIQKNPWVSDVVSSLSSTTFENDFIPDPQALKGTGLTANDASLALQYYATGFQAGNAWINGLSYPIEVQIDPVYLSNGQSLLNLPIYSPTLQSNLQAGQLGTFVVDEAPVSLTRYNRLYAGQFIITPKEGAPPPLTLQNELVAELTQQGLLGNGIDLSSGSSFSPQALAQQLAVTGSLTFLLAFFLAYLVMAAQFNSWRYPVYLLLPVPLALIGALSCVVLLGGGLVIFGLLGLLLLIGLAAKNAILYLDFVVARLDKMPFLDALVESARLRFRPIIMTTLTVLVVSGPLVFGHGEGSEFGQRLGVVMFGGIMFSSVLTFFVVPAAFYIFERKRNMKPAVALEGVADAGNGREILATNGGGQESAEPAAMGNGHDAGNGGGRTPATPRATGNGHDAGNGGSKTPAAEGEDPAIKV